VVREVENTRYGINYFKMDLDVDYLNIIESCIKTKFEIRSTKSEIVSWEF
jgi:hypothetical protein